MRDKTMRTLTVAGAGVLALVLSCAGGTVICINGGTECAGTTSQPITRSFSVDVAPGFKNIGCDIGACHGVTNSGQMRLDFVDAGITCQEAYDEIVTEDRADTADSTGPRVLTTDAGAQSFFILKSQSQTATAHDGGNQLEPSDSEYQVWVDWINQGRVNDCP